MCPMCIGTAALALSGGGAAGGVVLVIGYVTRKTAVFRSLRFWRKDRA